MTPDEIRSTTKFETAGLNKLDAIDSAQAFWLREIAAQLAYLCGQVEALETTIRMIGVRVQDAQDQAAMKPKKSPVPAGGGKRGGD